METRPLASQDPAGVHPTGGNPQDFTAGADGLITSQDACTDLLNECARTRVWIPLMRPYTLAKDYCAILCTVLEYLSRMTLLVVKPGPICHTGRNWSTAGGYPLSQMSLVYSTDGYWWRQVGRGRPISRTPFLALLWDCAAAQVGMQLHVIRNWAVRNSTPRSPAAYRVG